MNEKDNAWFELGGFPPDGTICECFDHGFGDFVKVKVLDASTERERAVVILQGGSYVKLFWGSKFRPIRTEREKTIEAAFSCLKNSGFDSDSTNVDYFNALYDAGLLRLPEGK